MPLSARVPGARNAAADMAAPADAMMKRRRSPLTLARVRERLSISLLLVSALSRAGPEGPDGAVITDTRLACQARGCHFAPSEQRGARPHVARDLAENADIAGRSAVIARTASARSMRTRLR